MVAFIDDCDIKNPKTLSEWVRNFRIKKIQMKRKLRGAGSDLRVNAILSTALITAEQELRRKQQERFSRWLEMQSKFVSPVSQTPNYGSTIDHSMDDEESESVASEYKRRREIEDNLWKSELSSLDDFMRSLNSSCNQRAISVKS